MNKISGALLVIGMIALSASGLSHAAVNTVELKGCSAVSDHDLDAIRGGFVGAGGLEVALGIVKAVSVDGVLQTTSTITIPNLASQNGITPVQVSNLQSNNAVFVQNTGNQIVVQNGLDQKTIQNVTTINVTTNALSLIRGQNLMSNINQQLRSSSH
jgi:hypothetical protein